MLRCKLVRFNFAAQSLPPPPLAEPLYTIRHPCLCSENKGLSSLFSIRTLDRFFSWSLGAAARHERLLATQTGNRHTCIRLDPI